MLSEEAPVSEDLVTTMSKKLPNYHIALYHITGNSYIISISQENQTYSYDEAGSDEIASILVSDMNNRILLYKKV